MLSNITQFSPIRDANVKNMSFDEIYKNFGRVLVLCKKSRIRSTDTKNIFGYSLIPMPVNIIKNTFIKNFLHILDYEYLNEHFAIDRTYFSNVDQKELILNLSHIDEQTINSFGMQFNGLCTFKDYIVSTLIDDYMAYSSTNEIVKHNRINMLQTINERSYWSLYSNCRLNISLQFMQRGFNLHLTQRLDDEKIKEIINKINKYDIDNDDNYLSYIYRKQVYVDAASNIKNKGFKLYRITTNPIEKMMDIEIFNKFIKENIYGNDKEYYYLIMNLLASKELCHYIINNQELLQNLHDTKFFSKYFYTFKYLLSYAWLTLYLEESIKKKNICKTDRFIFDINTACLLPDTPVQSDSTILKDSAYLPLLVSNQMTNLSDNVMGVSHRNREKIRYGVADLKTFLFRQQLFLTGINDFPILDNLDWSNIALSGSMIACCLPNFNPLMLKFMNGPDVQTQGTKLFLNYINEYYRDADIDMLCNLDGIEYIDKVHHVANTIENNIKEYWKGTDKLNTNKDLLVVLKPVKVVAAIINADFIRKYLLSTLEAKGMTWGEIITNINDIRIKQAIYPFYTKHKEQKNADFQAEPSNESAWTNPIYAPEFDIVGVEQLQIVFAKTKKDKREEEKEQKTKEIPKPGLVDELDDGHINDLVEEEDREYVNENDESEYVEPKSLIDEENVLFIINENLKYKISSPWLPHSIEAFKIRFNDYFGTVASFHLPIVRAYYDGTTVKMTPSCISACHTMINMDYKYFAGSKDPIEIINKYRIRGYGTILNDKEKIRFIEYNNLVEKWKNIYGIKLNDSLSIKKCFGFQNINSNMFSYSKLTYKEDTHYNNVSDDVSNSYDQLINNTYQTKSIASIIEIFRNVKFINEFGFVEPLKHYLIDVNYELKK